MLPISNGNSFGGPDFITKNVQTNFDPFFGVIF